MDDSTIRLIFFFGIFAVMAVWESFVPRRPRRVSRAARWSTNIGITIIDTIIATLLIPGAGVGMALLAQTKGWGILNGSAASVSPWISIPVCILFLDFLIYVQHVVFHRVKFFWRFHAVHHTDLDLDVTSGVRFHPVEIIFSLIIKGAAIFTLGIPILAVMIFEIILNGMAMFNHANVKLPGQADAIIRTLFVTPDMHRVHHSVIPRETDSNFGFNLSLWDRLCKTYTSQPAKGHLDMTLGLNEYQEKRWVWLWWILAMPFLPTRVDRNFMEKSDHH